MTTTISNPATFSSVRSAFNTEGYGISTSLYAYRQGGSIVPATSAFNVIGAGTAGDPLRLSQFSGFTVPSQATVYVDSLSVDASVGNVFNGEAECAVFFNNNGTLTYSLYAVGADPGRYLIVQGVNGPSPVGVYAQGETSLNGTLPGMWLTGGSASDYEIYITTSGSIADYTTVIGATRGVWTNMGTGTIELSVYAAVDDVVNQVFNIQIRRVGDNSGDYFSTSITMEVLAAGIN